jgi:hypothetical protein
MKYSKSEKLAARELFELAMHRDYENLKSQITSLSIDEPHNIWELKDLLNKKSREFDRKYDYRYSILDQLFVEFILEDLLKTSELKGLSKERQKYIETIVENIKKWRDI